MCEIIYPGRPPQYLQDRIERAQQRYEKSTDKTAAAAAAATAAAGESDTCDDTADSSNGSGSSNNSSSGYQQRFVKRSAVEVSSGDANPWATASALGSSGLFAAVLVAVASTSVGSPLLGFTGMCSAMSALCWLRRYRHSPARLGYIHSLLLLHR